MFVIIYKQECQGGLNHSPRFIDNTCTILNKNFSFYQQNVVLNNMYMYKLNIFAFNRHLFTFKYNFHVIKQNRKRVILKAKCKFWPFKGNNYYKDWSDSFERCKFWRDQWAVHFSLRKFSSILYGFQVIGYKQKQQKVQLNLSGFVK